MGLGGEKKEETQHKLLFDVYLRRDYRQQGNMELGPFEVGKQKQNENTKCHSSHTYRLFPRLLTRDIYFQKWKKSHQTLLMQIAGDNSKVAALETSPSLAASGPSDAAGSLAPGFTANSGGGAAVVPLCASL